MKRNIFLLILSFLLIGKMHAQVQEDHWTPDGATGSAVAMFWCEVFIDDETQVSGDIEVAEFVDGSCRQTTRVRGYFNNNFYRAMLNGQYDGAGHTITFKCYDHATGTEFDACPYTYTTTGATDQIGSAVAPVELRFTSPAPEYPWSVNPNQWQNNSFVIARVQTNGIDITDGTNWEVGAFCGNQCRGLCNMENGWVASSSTPYTYYMMMMIYGNEGDQLTFNLYDKANEEVYGSCDVTLTYTEEGYGDFWDPVILNFRAVESFTLDILGYGGNNNRYYLIASPIGEISPASVNQMLSNEYDLFYFDQAAEDCLEWINYKGEDGNYNLEAGKGYLYANSNDVTLTFTGYPGSNGEVVLTKCASTTAAFPGWNLVGNPFGRTAYLNRPFYIMNGNGDEIILSERNYVNKMEGVFVVANYDGEVMTFGTTVPAKSKQLVLNIGQNNNVIDRTAISFDEGNVLPKFQLNENSTKLYIPQDDKDFAVVIAKADMGEMPINFKAAEDGAYTLSLGTEEVDFNYLHLIDNQTGEDVDLFMVPSYTFNALTTDAANRFKLVFAADNGANDNFVFQNNGNWIVNNDGKATLQIVDVTGHIVSNEQIEGGYSLNFKPAAGVYMFRLINGNNVKVQKVVIR